MISGRQNPSIEAVSMPFQCRHALQMSRQESSERRVKLENVLHRAATGQSLSDKEPANSRRASAWWVGVKVNV